MLGCEIIFSITIDYVPVSYTHLDVYKRQDDDDDNDNDELV